MIRKLLSRDSIPDGPKSAVSWLRPMKVAFVLPADSVDAAVWAVQVCCLAWGGGHYILVPHGTDLDQDWAEVISNYDPDEVVDMVGLSDENVEQLEARGIAIQKWDKGSGSFLMPGSFIYSAAIAFLEQPNQAGLRFIVPSVPVDHPLRLPLLGRYGALIDETTIEKAKFDHGFVQGTNLGNFCDPFHIDFTAHLNLEILLDPPGLPPGTVESGQFWTLPRWTRMGVEVWAPGRPLLVSKHSPHEQVDRQHSSRVLVTGEPESISDLCLYWTLRATRPSGYPFPLWVPLPQLGTDEGRDVIRAALALADKLHPDPGSSLYVLSTSASQADVQSRLEGIRHKAVVTDGFADFVQPFVRRGFREAVEILFERGRANVPQPAEQRFNKFAHYEWITREIEMNDLRLPPIAPLKHSLMGVSWRITKLGFAHTYIPRYSTEVHSMQFPSTWETLSAVFEDLGFECSPSDKGRLGAALLELLGSLDRVALLSSTRIFDLLASLAETSGRQSFIKQLKKLIPDRTQIDADEVATAVAALKSPVNELRRTLSYSDVKAAIGTNDQAKALLGWLLERELLFRGAEIECPVCGLKLWYDISDFAREFRCVGCQKISKTPLESASTTWRYRLNELYARAYDQGVLPHLLTAYHVTYKSLSEGASLTGFYPGLDIFSKDAGVTAELDYVELRGGDLLIGECKVSAKGFGNDEANKLLRLAESLRATRLAVVSLAGSLEDGVAKQLEDGFNGEITILNRSDIFDKDPWAGEASAPNEYVEKMVNWLDFPVEDIG